MASARRALSSLPKLATCNVTASPAFAATTSADSAALAVGGGAGGTVVLAGAGSGGTDGQWIRIFADRFTPLDARHLPTGEIASVAGTAFDLRHWADIGKRVRSADPQLRASHGFDHNFVLRPGRAALLVAACAYDPASGRALIVATSQPGLQFYTANGFDGSLLGGAGKTLRQGDGYALETQHFPDSPNHANFPSTLLRAGVAFTSRTEFRFRTVAPKGPPVGAAAQRLDALGC